MARTAFIFLLMVGTALTLTGPADAQLLPFAWRQRPKILFRYGRGHWAYTNYQRYYDPGSKQYFWGWPGDFYGIEYSQPPLSRAIPPVLLLDLGGGVGWTRRVHILVRVPVKDAQVWFNDYLTPQQGYERSFDSPPVEPGVPFTYQVRARWGNGQERSLTVTLEAGQERVVDFTTGP